jgi:DNA-binding PadR family transcriptional regulator
MTDFQDDAPNGVRGGRDWTLQPPPRIDVKFPILGFLMEGEATGYDLKRRFRAPVGFFYRVSDGSLYPALKRLAADRLVTLRVESRGLRARKVYAITESGRDLFRRMLREPAQPLFVYDETQVKIYFGAHDPRAALEHMRRALREDEESAAMCTRLAAQMRRAGEGAFRRITLELGLAICRAKARALARLCAEFEHRIDNETGRGAGDSQALRRNGIRRQGETIRNERKVRR